MEALNDEIESIYSRKNTFCEKIKKDRAMTSYKEGKFSSFEEALENTKDINLLSFAKNAAKSLNKANAKTDEKEYLSINDKIDRLEIGKRREVYDAVKKICFKKVISKNEELDSLAMAMDYIVKNVLEITPKQFYSIYSVDKLKKYSLYAATHKIVELADIETKKACMFDSKLTFFKSVWPEEFKSKETNGRDVFFADENIKSGLKKAGQTKKLEGKEDKCLGKTVDEILMNAINDVLFDINQFENAFEIFQFLTEESTKYFEKGKNHAGICDIIADRQYPSLLDFYYMNCPVKFQEDYVMEYKAFRASSKIPPNSLIDAAVDIKIKKLWEEGLLPEDAIDEIDDRYVSGEMER